MAENNNAGKKESVNHIVEMKVLENNDPAQLMINNLIEVVIPAANHYQFSLFAVGEILANVTAILYLKCAKDMTEGEILIRFDKFNAIMKEAYSINKSVGDVTPTHFSAEKH